MGKNNIPPSGHGRLTNKKAILIHNGKGLLFIYEAHGIGGKDAPRFFNAKEAEGGLRHGVIDQAIRTTAIGYSLACKA